jgi:membrane-bound ClpP family serine protease
MVIYWKIYQEMKSQVLTGQEGMLRKTGMVIQNIDPEGKIKYATEIWNAVAEGKKWSSAAFHMACVSSWQNRLFEKID